ncbi:MAG: YggS family pyridoxal phosphate-dependent enzyme [Bacteroidales bacterium]|jgi:pyridoxal phosphate enzyme (YggS family)|nr:YggS family pyridoxal phosphate-dependent enzyme [Bacteroidales bacterium]
MLKDNLLTIKNSIPPTVRLIAVSKFQSIEKLQEAYSAGQRDFGENRPQELRDKFPLLPDDVRWHFIGNLQSNKIKYVVPCAFMIHSISSPELLLGINAEAKKLNKIMDCLIEFHIATETSKQGFNFDEAIEFLKSDTFHSLNNVRIRGVMGMASFVDDENQVRNEFKNLKSYFYEIKKQFYPEDEQFRELSMGMSHDYKIAIEEGSTMIRIGTAIFGKREYSAKI